MSTAKPISYSAAVAGSTKSNSENDIHHGHEKSQEQQEISPKEPQKRVSSIKRSPSPSHRPRTQAEEETVYVLTLLTDRRLHERMTALRNQYFPKRIKKLAAHLTLFHALPESRLESNIIPLLKEVTAKTSPFAIKADKPFRLKKGFAVSVSSRIGGSQAKQIHQALQDGWMKEDFLSEQDAGGCRLHYTLMNKVDNEVDISKAYDDLLDHWRSESGTAEGLALWKYDRGFWKWKESFQFGGD
ncbi:hypothetical protein PRZ48_005911 [Zasmidium cellare]|uniref:Uncharacterized protein n=1 Tax=Zasmidium cellare TaxID=395010 RepID=A0ABR0ELN1_ZASCE|nr:hypothetical protein PRZ48_005911 [Zasmidium cellare]